MFTPARRIERSGFSMVNGLIIDISLSTRLSDLTQYPPVLSSRMNRSPCDVVKIDSQLAPHGHGLTCLRIGVRVPDEVLTPHPRSYTPPIMDLRPQKRHAPLCGTPIPDCMPGPIQRTLYANNGMLSVSKTPSYVYPPPLWLIPRTPALEDLPQWIITYSPNFRYSFFDLPPEVRLQIYRLLLLAEAPIDDPICSSCKCIIKIEKRRSSAEDIKWDQRRIYPAILECSRQINKEGTPILYAENMFDIWGRYQFDWGLHTTLNRVCHMWQFSKINIGFVVGVQVSNAQNWHHSHFDELLVGFPSVSLLKITTKQNLGDWKDFVEKLGTKVRHLECIVFDLEIGYDSILRDPSGRNTH
ncbi:hypothetical protein DL98DRAFT_259278 [Cadophora sp. DSE1049]|nr:hypothetical protein DL98DRAFT_259278 [Cadophora sp. DSE1049]